MKNNQIFDLLLCIERLWSISMSLKAFHFIELAQKVKVNDKLALWWTRNRYEDIKKKKKEINGYTEYEQLASQPDSQPSKHSYIGTLGGLNYTKEKIDKF